MLVGFPHRLFYFLANFCSWASWPWVHVTFVGVNSGLGIFQAFVTDLEIENTLLIEAISTYTLLVCRAFLTPAAIKSTVGGGVLDVSMHDRSRMTIGSHIPTICRDGACRGPTDQADIACNKREAPSGVGGVA